MTNFQKVYFAACLAGGLASAYSSSSECRHYYSTSYLKNSECWRLCEEGGSEAVAFLCQKSEYSVSNGQVALGPREACYSDQVYGYTNDNDDWSRVDFTGEKHSAGSAAECQEICHDTPGCAWWHFNVVNDGNVQAGACALKSEEMLERAAAIRTDQPIQGDDVNFCNFQMPIVCDGLYDCISCNGQPRCTWHSAVHVAGPPSCRDEPAYPTCFHSTEAPDTDDTTTTTEEDDDTTTTTTLPTSSTTTSSTTSSTTVAPTDSTTTTTHSTTTTDSTTTPASSSSTTTVKPEETTTTTVAPTTTAPVVPPTTTVTPPTTTVTPPTTTVTPPTTTAPTMAPTTAPVVPPTTAPVTPPTTTPVAPPTTGPVTPTTTTPSTSSTTTEEAPISSTTTPAPEASTTTGASDTTTTGVPEEETTTGESTTTAVPPFESTTGGKKEEEHTGPATVIGAASGGAAAVAALAYAGYYAHGAMQASSAVNPGDLEIGSEAVTGGADPEQAVNVNNSFYN